jgi:hypothetical protein
VTEREHAAVKLAGLVADLGAAIAGHFETAGAEHTVIVEHLTAQHEPWPLVESQRPKVRRPDPTMVSTGYGLGGRTPPRDMPAGSGGLGGAPGRILAVLAQFPDGRTRRQVAALAGLAARKSTIRNALSTLRTRGLIAEHGEHLVLTDAGVDAAGGVDPLPSGPELLEHWRAEIGGGAPRRIFDLLVAEYPRALGRDEITAATGDDGSTLRNALSKLRSLDLIVGNVCASHELMDAIR